jgi:hypothetical protein
VLVVAGTPELDDVVCKVIVESPVDDRDVVDVGNVDFDELS